MKSRFSRDAFGWGAGLWFLGYMLGIMLFPFVPKSAIGWVISPFAVAVTLLVLVKRVQGPTLAYYFGVAMAWAAIAVLGDYVFLVKALNAGGYYKPDVYLYYALTLALPPAVGAWKLRRRPAKTE